jgi:hypothetical protein
VFNDPVNLIDPDGLEECGSIFKKGSHVKGITIRWTGSGVVPSPPKFLGSGGVTTEKKTRRCSRDSMDEYRDYVKPTIARDSSDGANVLSYQAKAILEQIGWKDCP